jgi:uncharacterized protein (DUF2236 family)
MATGARDMAGPAMFPVDAVITRVDSEMVVLLGGGRALLMQVAHPKVARAVCEHSEFERDPFSRLQRTLAAVYTVVFGSPTQAARAVTAVGRVHERVAGADYRADDPELLLWVHATLVDTAMRVHGRFLRPLEPAEAERYYQESTAVGAAFGVPRERQPDDFVAFRRYVRGMVADLAPGLTADSRQVAAAVLHPRMPLPVAPLMAVARELTAGLLPAPLRRGYGLPWDPGRQLVLDTAALATRTVLPRVPAVLRRVPTGALARIPIGPPTRTA